MPDAGADPGAPAPGPQPIDRAEVAHVARLARLDLTPEELELFTSQLASVLRHAADVAALELSDVVPTAHPQPLRNVLRDDELVPCLPRDEVLAGAPEVDENRFRVPRITGQPG
jgi:aspartyl-tRNA(Asn)/glutamyl-tRNA(Gln) amidotransferase subunit C